MGLRASSWLVEMVMPKSPRRAVLRRSCQYLVEVKLSKRYSRVGMEVSLRVGRIEKDVDKLDVAMNETFPARPRLILFIGPIFNDQESVNQIVENAPQGWLGSAQNTWSVTMPTLNHTTRSSHNGFIVVSLRDKGA